MKSLIFTAVLAIFSTAANAQDAALVRAHTVCATIVAPVATRPKDEAYTTMYNKCLKIEEAYKASDTAKQKKAADDQNAIEDALKVIPPK